MAGSNSKEEPGTAPEPERWYNLTLGSSFNDHHQSPKFCTLRYEFKPASIDKKQPGSLHRNKDNRVSVEFQNNQHGKPKVMFEGISEDYKDNDAVLFFDGETFRLERLHRAVKRLRHVRLPGEPVATTATTVVTSNASMPESGSPTLGKGTKFQSLSKDILHQNPVEMETFDINSSQGGGKTSVNDADPSSSHPNISTASSDPRNYEVEEQIDILNNSDDDDDGYKATEKGDAAEREFTTGIDINVPHQADMDDDEMADVDVSGDEAESGPNAAEALRAQVNAEGRGSHSSSSTSSSSSSSGSGSGSSDSESGSSSSDSESGDGDGDSINSI